MSRVSAFYCLLKQKDKCRNRQQLWLMQRTRDYLTITRARSNKSPVNNKRCKPVKRSLTKQEKKVWSRTKIIALRITNFFDNFWQVLLLVTNKRETPREHHSSQKVLCNVVQRVAKETNYLGFQFIASQIQMLTTVKLDGQSKICLRLLLTVYCLFSQRNALLISYIKNIQSQISFSVLQEAKIRNGKSLASKTRRQPPRILQVIHCIFLLNN